MLVEVMYFWTWLVILGHVIYYFLFGTCSLPNYQSTVYSKFQLLENLVVKSIVADILSWE